MSSSGYLIDTHVLLWMLTEPARLSGDARQLVADRSNDLRLSAASAWEISTKNRLGKLPRADVLLRAFEQHLTRLGVQLCDIPAEHGLLAGALDWTHRDPFDRMIAAQCMIESLPLVTSDAAFGTVTGVRVIW